MLIQIFLSSDLPLEPLPNPHMKLLSINEALEQGLEVPRSMLMDYELDPDEPGMIMHSDIEPVIDIANGIFEMPDPEDNFDIWPLEETEARVNNKPYTAAVEWSRCTMARAEMLLDYIRAQLDKGAEMELCRRCGETWPETGSGLSFEELDKEFICRFCGGENGERLIIKR